MYSHVHFIYGRIVFQHTYIHIIFVHPTSCEQTLGFLCFLVIVNTVTVCDPAHINSLFRFHKFTLLFVYIYVCVVYIPFIFLPAIYKEDSFYLLNLEADSNVALKRSRGHTQSYRVNQSFRVRVSEIEPQDVVLGSTIAILVTFGGPYCYAIAMPESLGLKPCLDAYKECAITPILLANLNSICNWTFGIVIFDLSLKFISAK